MPTTGEKPGKGAYRCTSCGQVVVLDNDTDTLPPCPRCDGTDFTKSQEMNKANTSFLKE